MQLNLLDFTKNNYTNPRRPVQEMLVEMGWSWSMAGKVAKEYSAFEVEKAIEAAKFQSAKQGKNLVKMSYVVAILRGGRNKNNNINKNPHGKTVQN